MYRTPIRTSIADTYTLGIHAKKTNCLFGPISEEMMP